MNCLGFLSCTHIFAMFLPASVAGAGLRAAGRPETAPAGVFVGNSHTGVRLMGSQPNKS